MTLVDRQQLYKKYPACDKCGKVNFFGKYGYQSIWWTPHYNEEKDVLILICNSCGYRLSVSCAPSMAVKPEGPPNSIIIDPGFFAAVASFFRKRKEE
jgi:hypothetical protein